MVVGVALDVAGLRGSGNLQHRALPQQPSSVRLRDALLPGQPTRPAGAVDHADSLAATYSGHAAGVGYRAATATGELRFRSGEDAGVLHPERTAFLIPCRRA